MWRKIISETVEAIFDQIWCSFLQKTHCSYLSCSKKIIWARKNRWGGIFSRPWSLFINWGFFKNWGLNPQFLKTPQKAPWDWTKCLPSAPKMIFLGPNNFFCATEIWAMCFLQKTAPDLVKYGLHSLAYNLPPHIGGRHSVLYFTIQATKKYSNSNVLGNAQMNCYIFSVGLPL